MHKIFCRQAIFVHTINTDLAPIWSDDAK